MAKIDIANVESLRRQREAETERTATASKKVQATKALEEFYSGEHEAENARAERERSSQMADVVVPAEIDKQKVEIEAKGIFEVLTKQAEGLDKIVQAAGNDPKDTALLLIADKLPELVEKQAEAIKNIKIDKVTVWDSGAKTEDGKNSTANFISGMYKSVSPLQEMFNMAGCNYRST